MKPSTRLPLAAAALAGAAALADAQVMSVEIVTPPATFDQAVGVSPNGQFVVGTGGTNGFRWSEVGGLVTGFDYPLEAWGVSNDGTVISGTFANPSGQLEAGIWTSSGGGTLLGTVPGGNPCGSDFSHLFGLDADGDVAVGMAWKDCRTSPIRWEAGVGLTEMAKQNADSSARATRVSGDGTVAVGWDQGLAGGPGNTRRASVWLDPSTQVFPTTSATNPNGYGECTDVNSDGTVICGTTQNLPFLWTLGGGLQILPSVPGLTGEHTTNAVSEDGSVAVGVRFGPCCPPTLDAIVWTPSGATRLFDMLTAAGVTGYVASDFQNATGISADGKIITGWGNGNAWIVRIDTWHDIGAGLAGSLGTPELTASGDLSGGSTLQLDVAGTPGTSPVGILIGLSSLGLPFNGGTLVPFPTFFDGGFTDAGGALTKSYPVPNGFPFGAKLYAQAWVSDATGPFGWTSTNALLGVTP